MRLWDWFCLLAFVMLLLGLSVRSMIYVTRIWQEWHGNLQMTTQPNVLKLVQNCDVPSQTNNRAEYYLYQYHRLGKPCAD